ncbi:hypothetical protein D8B26_004922 [Coccidioides posadasii str. Silveira]|uniref:uncharacterized protein n=1 Tax=Coccidioides posadasii (strain RMSCC 757 / Silveira) TaxID=443226 RepID=UPI001BEFDBC2|nr:hypothetical protein D8B26_004922 [Coccidioides posadasii str. Silveira]
MRASNAYSSGAIKYGPASFNLKFQSNRIARNYFIGGLQVISTNLGLELQWKPGRSKTWIEDTVKQLLIFAAGFIPVIDPLVAIAFPLMFKATDPANFDQEYKSVVPGSEGLHELKQDIMDKVPVMRQLMDPAYQSRATTRALPIPASTTPDTMGSTRSLLPKTPEQNDTSGEDQIQSLDKIGPNPCFKEALEILAKTAHEPGDFPPDIADDTTEARYIIENPQAGW